MILIGSPTRQERGTDHVGVQDLAPIQSTLELTHHRVKSHGIRDVCRESAFGDDPQEMIQAIKPAIDRLLDEEVKPPLRAADGCLDVQVCRIGYQRNIETLCTDLVPSGDLRDPQIVQLLAHVRAHRHQLDLMREVLAKQRGVAPAYRTESQDEDSDGHHAPQRRIVTLPVSG